MHIEHLSPRLLLPAALVLALAACGRGDDGGAGAEARPQGNRWGTLEFVPCALSNPAGGKGIDARCTTLEVPEDPASPDGRRIGLNIAWVPASNETDATADPLFMLAGGPGQAAVATYPQLDAAFKEVRKTRHVILVDQRGTGKSNLLDCPMDDPEQLADAANMGAMASRCRHTLQQRADLRFYTTGDAIRDLDTVRQALGVPRINLMGVSYGTRVAQQYALQHPQHTRTVLLDSVVPNTLPLGNLWARNLEDALALQFARCEGQPTCKDKLGAPREQLDALMTRLRSDPPLVRYRDAATNQQREERLTPEMVTGLVRMFAYAPHAAALLPNLIHEANRGRYDGLMALTRMLSDTISDSMAMGMQFSVICAEDGDSLVAREEDAGTLLGNSITEGIAAACRDWPRGTVAGNFRTPLSGELPVLAISGEHDPVTPPRYGDEAVAGLPNGRHLTLRGQGHNVIGAGCMPKLFAQFVERADATGLDATCLDNLTYVPPFTSFNGWEP
ncbi:MAG: alpha/beta fold hydrolase [Pseudoxanthomonas suwonensis]|nr:alpha/beta fold hydrolase [Pseudoxanthomonas suwonensis]